jgi:peroxiredoxin
MTDPTLDPTDLHATSAAVVDPLDEKLDGEDKDALVGIMYSERSWVVPPWSKVVFFWCAIALIGGLAYYEIAKHVTFRRLLVDSVVEPEDVGTAPAPEITLPAGEGGAPVSLSQFKGQWVVVNFWATWCPPCRDEMPSMEMLNRRFQQKGLNVKLLAVSVDEDWREVNRFFGETKPTFTVLWDKDKRGATAYSTHKYPETYIISPDGRVAAKFTGPRDWYNQATVQYFDDLVAGRRKPA